MSPRCTSIRPISLGVKWVIAWSLTSEPEAAVHVPTCSGGPPSAGITTSRTVHCPRSRPRNGRSCRSWCRPRRRAGPPRRSRVSVGRAGRMAVSTGTPGGCCGRRGQTHHLRRGASWLTVRPTAAARAAAARPRSPRTRCGGDARPGAGRRRPAACGAAGSAARVRRRAAVAASRRLSRPGNTASVATASAAGRAAGQVPLVRGPLGRGEGAEHVGPVVKREPAVRHLVTPISSRTSRRARTA